MDLKQLRYFLSTVEYKNMTRAAEALHIAQPALSQQMRSLESELNTKLFERMPTGVVPTEEGLLLEAKARLILKHVDEAKAIIQMRANSPVGKVSVALPSSTGKVLALPLFRAVKVAYPGVSLEFIESPSGDLEKLFDTAKIDVLIGVDISPIGRTVTRPLAIEQLFLIKQKPDNNASKTLPSVDITELLTNSLALPAPPNTIRKAIDALSTYHGLNYRLVTEINSTPLLVQAVREGIAASVLPWSAVGDEVARGELSLQEITEPRLCRTLMSCSASHSDQTNATKGVLNLIPQVIRQLVGSGSWQGVTIPLATSETITSTQPNER